MLLVKSQTVIDCLQLSDTETRDDKKNDVFISEKLHFHFMGEEAYSKLDTVQTMGTRGKINAISWNIIKLSKQKLVDICGHIQQICKKT